MQANLTILREKISRWAEQCALRTHINTAQNLLNIAPRGSNQAVFGRSQTQKKHCW